MPINDQIECKSPHAMKIKQKNRKRKVILHEHTFIDRNTYTSIDSPAPTHKTEMTWVNTKAPNEDCIISVAGGYGRALSIGTSVVCTDPVSSGFVGEASSLVFLGMRLSVDHFTVSYHFPLPHYNTYHFIVERKTLQFYPFHLDPFQSLHIRFVIIM